MIRKLSRSAAFGLGALLLASASVVTAQTAERPADRLSRYLRELAADPTSLTALIGAGNASLDVGDGNAALGFFARADERAPRNGQVKAGLARALLMVDNPREALKMFDAARSLGVPDIQLAPDRGLAYDLRGDNRRAQQDYALVLGRGPNDEVTKRYALSLGITGERDRALQLLEPLLYKRDQGAWRARAFVLAMTGDTRGANTIVRQVMPERMAQTMEPFLARLASLNPAQKAAAVHLGEMPSNVRYAASPAQAQPSAVTPSPTPSVAASAQVQGDPESRAGRRRPGAAAVPLASPPPPRTTRSRPAPTPVPTPTPTPTPTPPAPLQYAAADRGTTFAQPAASGPAYLPAPSSAPAALPQQERGDLDAIIRSIREAAATPAPTRTPAARLAQATPRPKPTPTPIPTPTVKADAKKVEPAKTTKPDPKAVAAKDQKADPKSAKAAAADKKKKPEPPKHPARIWVQVAGGANAAALPKEWASVTAKAADVKGKGPWSAKNRATNRLLAGPFKTDAEAQAMVSKLRKAGVGAFAWKSDEGEAVEKIGGK